MKITKVRVLTGANPHQMAEDVNRIIAEASAEGLVLLDVRLTATPGEGSDWYTYVLLLGVA